MESLQGAREGSNGWTPPPPPQEGASNMASKRSAPEWAVGMKFVITRIQALSNNGQPVEGCLPFNSSSEARDSAIDTDTTSLS
jgi:hypothetical protein